LVYDGRLARQTGLAGTARPVSGPTV